MPSEQVPSPQQGTFELFSILWRYRLSLLWAALLCAALGLALGVALPMEHRARAVLLPLTTGQVQTLLPQALPQGLVKEGTSAFAPDVGDLFKRLHAELSVILGQRADDDVRHRLDWVQSEQRHTIELVLHASTEHEALTEEMFAVLREAASKVWRGVLHEYDAVRRHRMDELRHKLDNLLHEEALHFETRRGRLKDELQVVEALLATAPAPQPQVGMLLWQRGENKTNLFEEELPLYLLDRDQLQRRAAQIRVQMVQLERAPEGLYREAVTAIRGQLHWYESLPPLTRDDPGMADRLLRFEALPVLEPVSLIKRLLLFFAGGFMLGLLLRLAWALLQEGIGEGEGSR